MVNRTTNSIIETKKAAKMITALFTLSFGLMIQNTSPTTLTKVIAANPMSGMSRVGSVSNINTTLLYSTIEIRLVNYYQ
jgi:hypothetical protein